MSASPPPAGVLVERLLAACAERGSVTAMSEASGASIGYARLGTLVEHLSAGLHADGLRPGDRLAFAMPPSIRSTAVLLACIRAGIVPVLIDPGAGPEVLSARMRLAAPAAVAADAITFAATGSALGRWVLRRRGVTLAPLAQIAPRRIVAGPWMPALPYPSRRLAQIARRGRGSQGWTPRLSDADTAAIIFTSGTTGAPRGVRHSGTSLGATIAAVGSLARLEPTAVVASADAHLVVPALLAGARVEFPPRGADPRALLRHAVRVRATHLGAVPVDADDMAAQVHAGRSAFPPSLRLLVLGSAPSRRRTLERLAATLQPSIGCWSVYGATEMLPIAAVSLQDKLAYAGNGDLVGRPLPGVRIAIAEGGEVMVDGPNRAPGYLGAPDLTRHATGDIGAVLDDGQLVLHGRRKEMLLRRGANIYPGLYEPTVERIGDVAAAVIVGDADPATGDERVVLFVVPAKAGADKRELADRVRDSLRSGPLRIDPFAQPDEILVVDRIPVSGRSRKPDRRALEAAAAQHRLRVPS